MEDEDYDEQMESREASAEEDGKVRALIEAINANPYDFPRYQELIEIYRIDGRLEELREARNQLHDYYCLPLDMWLEWLEDEEKIYEAGNGDVEDLLSLYERAVGDYRYYKVCRWYCKLALRLFEEGKIDAQRVRDVHEFVLQIYGLDVNRSLKFWEPYLKFELGIIEGLQEGEEKNKQLGRIRSIYRRRVMFPTADSIITWNEYSEWEQDEAEKLRVKQRHEQASAKIEQMVGFEENFQQAFSQLESDNDIQPMLALLSEGLKVIAGDNFNYVLLYFERILSEYTLNRDLWALFLGYADDLCKKKEERVRIYEKSTKNCPKDLDFWLGYLRELEKNEADSGLIGEKVIDAISKAGDELTYQY